jgi:hypothetical protein
MNGNNLFSVFLICSGSEQLSLRPTGGWGMLGKSISFPRAAFARPGGQRQYLVIPILELANPLTGVALAIGAMVIIKRAD